MSSPAETVALSGVLKTATSPQLTVMSTGPTVGLLPLPVETAAVFETVPLFGQFPGVAPVVGLTMWTCVVAPEGRSVGPKLRTPAGVVQPGSVLVGSGSIVQLRPALVGRLSLTVTPVAAPAPVLVTVTS